MHFPCDILNGNAVQFSNEWRIYMTTRTKSHKMKIFIIAILCIAILAAVTALLYRPVSDYFTQKNDRERISTELYDTVFLSMFPTDSYSEQDFIEFREQYTLKTDYTIPDMETLKSYMTDITNSLNTVSTAYLGIRPEAINGEELIALTEEYPYIQYNIILPYPSMDYWLKLSEEEVTGTLQQYQDLAELLLSKSNIRTFFFLKEWLVCNSANYDDAFLTNEGISKLLMLNCDELHNYYLTQENIDDTFTEFKELVDANRNHPVEYPKLSDYKIVFFGDSIIGNYTDTSSIPGVVSGLTGAATYNCAQSGYSATINPNCPMPLPEIVDCFIAKDTASLPQDTQLYLGVTEYIEEHSKADKLCFVLNYGLNDYFNGVPISLSDSYDISSYSGALRTAVESLQKAYPEAQIIVTTPNFTSFYENGSEPLSEVGGVLADYADAVIAIGSEYGIAVVDNYTELGINPDNDQDYLADGCHPNELTRFIMGQRIAQCIQK